MSSSRQGNHWRPVRPLRLPLQTGDGFSMSLFLLGFAFVPAVLVAAAGLLLLGLGHWLLGPLLALIGAFLVGAFWSFPRETWVARPADVLLDEVGFRVVGGYYDGTSLKWDELDGGASGTRDGRSIVAEELVAVTRDGRQVPVAEGEELGSFLALLDVWRSADGLEPLPDDARYHDRGSYRLPEPGRRASRSAAQGRAGKRKGKRKRSRGKQPSAEGTPVEPVHVQLIRCARCGAAACPADAPTTPCLYCGEAVPMPEAIRERLRAAAASQAAKAQSERLLERLLDQPAAWITVLPLWLLGAGMLSAWLFGACVFTTQLLRGQLSIGVVLWSLVSPLLLTITLALVASVVVSRRVAVRDVALGFAAVAPAERGKPCECRVCGAPLPLIEAPVLRCVYCSSSNILASARPRAPTHVRDQRKSLEDTLGAQQAEQLVRAIFLVLAGLPSLWGCWLALRWLWRALG